MGTQVRATNIEDGAISLDKLASPTFVTSNTSAQAGGSYVADSGSRIAFALPTSISVGQKFSVVGKGAGGWKITQTAGQTIHFGSTSTVVGVTGYLQSSGAFDCVELMCSVANTNFIVTSVVGNVSVLTENP